MLKNIEKYYFFLGIFLVGKKNDIFIQTSINLNLQRAIDTDIRKRRFTVEKIPSIKESIQQQQYKQLKSSDVSKS